MYISKLVIHGFKSIYHTEIAFSQGKNVLIGKNNVGKSNIVRALDIVLNEKYPTYADIDTSDFHQGMDGTKEPEFWILCEIKGNDADFERISSIKGIWRACCEESPISLSSGPFMINNELLFEDPDLIGTAYKTYFKNGGSKNKIDEYIKSLEQADAYYFIFKAYLDENNEEKIIREFRFFYQEKARNWYFSWGLSKEFRDSLITSAILPSFREPSAQLKITNWSWYGKLLKSQWDKQNLMHPGITQGLNEALEQVRKIGNPIYADLSEEINRKIRVGFSNTNVRLQFVATSPHDIHKQVRIYVKDDGVDDGMNYKGSGIQSAIVIGLFSYYCAVHHKNTSVLVIEEPEVFLHPQARRAISQRLDEFVKIHSQQDIEKNNQVIITTHSSEFIQSGEAGTIVVVKKSRGQTTVAAIDLTSSDADQKQIQKAVRASSAEMFFADNVILCEGAEVHLLPRIADILKKCRGALDEYNISVIRVDGKGSFKSYSEVLDQIGVPWLILADLDFFIEGLDKFTSSLEFYNLKNDISQLLEGWKITKRIKEKMLQSDKSKDAKAFVEAMSEFEENPSDLAREKLLEIWKYVKPSLKTKISKEILDSNPDLQQRLDSYLDNLFTQSDILILKNGELENYVRADTEEGLGLSGSKINDAQLLKICRDDSANISNYFHLEEFVKIIKRAFDAKSASIDKMHNDSQSISCEEQLFRDMACDDNDF